jgi:hypothetical protein
MAALRCANEEAQESWNEAKRRLTKVLVESRALLSPGCGDAGPHRASDSRAPRCPAIVSRDWTGCSKRAGRYIAGESSAGESSGRERRERKSLREMELARSESAPLLQNRGHGRYRTSYVGRRLIESIPCFTEGRPWRRKCRHLFSVTLTEKNSSPGRRKTPRWI